MRVTFAYPYTDEDGKTYEPDKSADLDDEVARTLIHDGKARPADDGKASDSADEPTSKKKGGS